ncbi:glycosyltransferase involved in cell wall biosynthesis [Pedobacter sp. CAN_A7]|uniref:glycosyltransferase family 4 protein n=1 Tax=Pedobacter sp. CAN_A7 TaxID=2787722 RepID=UPI0018CB634C
MVKTHKLFFAINSLHGGGAERVISNLGNYFCKRGYDVTLVCLNDAKPAYFLEEGIRVISLIDTERSKHILYRIWYGGVTFCKLLYLLGSEKPSCVVSFMTSANLWVGLTCNILKTPYLVSERVTPDYTVNRLNYFLRRLSASIYSKSKAIVVPSKGMVDGFRKNKSFRRLSNFEVINNPVSKFIPASLESVYPRKFILSVGRLDHQKGFDLLIDAFAKLTISDVDLLILGEGNERKNLESQIKRLNLNHRVKLIGYQNNLQDYYKQAELFVLSSRNEGYPNVLVEAMSLGCACVANDCEYGPSDIIEHEKNGLLVKVNNTKQLSEAIKRAISDPVLKINMSVNAQLINQTNSLENTFTKWENLIQNHI